MSNAPDRFDGFHSFNLCCRKKADTGRHDTNMRSYTTDRRVFEFWSEGDWIAADRLMGLISARFHDEPCADGGDGPCTADHIGPLSLGFSHRPEFRLLSKAANSAKNNRMLLSDVKHLRNLNIESVNIISWYAKPLWDTCKNLVKDEETALRISKLLRDNQRNAMHLLSKLLRFGAFTFLASLLELEYADRNIEYVNLRIDNYLTKFDEIQYTPRITKYSSEQKARRIRIGFNALHTYETRYNRHHFYINDEGIENAISNLMSVLSKAPKEIKKLDIILREILTSPIVSEESLRIVSNEIPRLKPCDCFIISKAYLNEAMTIVGENLSRMWNSDRYVRAHFDFDDN